MSKNLIKLIISIFISLTLGIILGNNVEEILGITGFFFLIAVIILIHLNNKKLRIGCTKKSLNANWLTIAKARAQTTIISEIIAKFLDCFFNYYPSTPIF